MNASNDVGLQHKKVVIALEIARPILEALATIIGLLKLVALDHGSHRAIENKNALFRGGVEGGDAFIAVHCRFILKPLRAVARRMVRDA